MASTPQDLLRQIPSVERVLQALETEPWADGAARPILTEAAREAVDRVRAEILEATEAAPSEEAVESAVLAIARTAAARAVGPHFRKVINATGIVLHTGLGRAVLPPAAMQRIRDHLAGYSLLQLDPETGKRSRRDERIEWLLTRLTGAEAATVVNNNAAATMLVLNTVAAGRETIVSRGQLVEIGGSFRLPEVMAASGARMVEVGTTNKTHLRDYEAAITDETAAILRVHPSNYQIVGFTSEVPLADLVELARRRGVVLIDDVGAGSLVDFSRFGFAYEPTLPDSVAAGADLVTSSADKLLGATQGGIILGRRDLVDAIRKNPLARIVRVDKLTLAALEATLALFFDEARALAEVPTLRMILRSVQDIESEAKRIAEDIRRAAPESAEGVEVVAGFSQVGSGSLPGQDLPTRLVSLVPQAGTSAEALAARLRLGDPPVFARIREGRVLLDPRTLQEGEREPLVRAVAAVLRAES